MPIAKNDLLEYSFAYCFFLEENVMRRIVLSLVTFLAFFYMPQAMANMPVGTWTTMDDKTGKKRAVVELSLKNGELSGKIVKVFREKGDKGICAKCPGEFKNKPIEGLTFLWGLKDQGRGVWSSGQILDPKSGKIYRAKLSMHGDKLYVRGYVGLAMLGRTQVWVKKISASENHDPSMA